jgi:DNA-directed RNA polymerase subunit N (RpoN/RPB10)
MTISGEFTKGEILSRRLKVSLGCLVFGAGGFAAGLHILENAARHHYTLDTFTRTLVVGFFPIMGLAAFVLANMSDGWRIVRYTCDDTTFRFWKLRSIRAETRRLFEVSKVEEVRGRDRSWKNPERNVLVGYEIGFRDGGTAYLGAKLPNAGALADWLRLHRQPAPPSSGGMLGFVKFVYGRMQVVPTDSIKIGTRTRARYAKELAALADLGCEYLCCFGETFSIFRLVFLLPAFVLFMMLLERRPIYLRGARIMVCYPLAISRDHTIWANPNESGAKLYTAFTDGTFLVSAMGEIPETSGTIMTKFGGAKSIAELWSSHQRRIQEFESQGKRIDRQSAFAAFVDLWEKETAIL